MVEEAEQRLDGEREDDNEADDRVSVPLPSCQQDARLNALVARSTYLPLFHREVDSGSRARKHQDVGKKLPAGMEPDQAPEVEEAHP